MKTKKDWMESISTNITESKLCPDLADQCQGLIMGEGNLDADILFIGEAPGETEDKLGRPFVGASGKLLEKMLQKINLKREAVYITNIVKYRPPNNRDPLPEEKEAFLPFLLQQIAVISPKVIVTLGKHSAEAILPDKNPSKIRGLLQRNRAGRVVLPMFHPAAGLYNPNNLVKIEEDFLTLQKFLAGDIHPPEFQNTLL